MPILGDFGYALLTHQLRTNLFDAVSRLDTLLSIGVFCADFMENSKGSFWKFAAWFSAIIFVVVGGYVGWRIYDIKQKQQKVAEGLELLKKIKEESYREAMADTYGGKTPQETLQMYIDAVEKGDYVLASKYFIGDHQEKELKSLRSSPRENIDNVVAVLKGVVLDDKRALLERMYESDLKQYGVSESKEDYISRVGKIYEGRETMSAKVSGYGFSVSFKLYPNGIWKIIEF